MSIIPFDSAHPGGMTREQMLDTLTPLYVKVLRTFAIAEAHGLDLRTARIAAHMVGQSNIAPGDAVAFACYDLYGAQVQPAVAEAAEMLDRVHVAPVVGEHVTIPGHLTPHRVGAAALHRLVSIFDPKGWVWRVWHDGRIAGSPHPSSGLDLVRMQFHQFAAVVDDARWVLTPHLEGTHMLAVEATFAGHPVQAWDLQEMPEGTTVDDLSALPSLDAQAGESEAVTGR